MNDAEERLRRLLGVAPASWIRTRLRGHYERDRRLPKHVSRRDATAEERDWVDRLYGRRPSSGSNLSVDVARLESVLVEAGLCADLVEALTILDGPLRDRAAERADNERTWASVLASAERRVRGMSWLERWLGGLVESGQLRRTGAGDPVRAGRLLDQALDLAMLFPLPGVALPELAAVHVGDAHALDKGRELGLLTVRAAASLGELDDWTSADGRRESWAAAGVVCDELSAPVLTLGLEGLGEGLTDRVLRAHRALGEPCLLGVRQLVRHRPDLSWAAGRDVFVCENPTIVAVAAARLGTDCSPLVCTSGHLRAATRVLCRSLSRAGALLRVRADFDVAGLHIAGKTLALPNARPWRMDAQTYLDSTAGPALRRAPPDARWAPTLVEAMKSRGVAVHEESLLETLLADLSR